MIASYPITYTGCTGLTCYCAYGYSGFTNYNFTATAAFSNIVYVHASVTPVLGNDIFRDIDYRSARAIKAFREAAKDQTPRAAAVPPRQPPPVSLALAAAPLQYASPVYVWNEKRWKWRRGQQTRGREPISHRRRIRTWERNKDA
jgi:hypothetical protein